MPARSRRAAPAAADSGCGQEQASCLPRGSRRARGSILAAVLALAKFLRVSNKMPLFALMLALAMGWPPVVTSFSTGGGDPDRQGSPVTQPCDAIYTCGSGVCPAGMTLVAPPVRSDTYTFRTALGANPNDDPKGYVPGELLPLYVSVTRRQIRGKEEAGQKVVGNETAKYIGLLVYAVQANDPLETKVGGWEVPLESNPKLWTPPDAPGCNGRALMHTGAELKGCVLLRHLSARCQPFLFPYSV